jgi:hypothetical protein
MTAALQKATATAGGAASEMGHFRAIRAVFFLLEFAACDRLELLNKRLIV